VQAKFTGLELTEFANLDGCTSHVDERDLVLNAASIAELADKMNRDGRKKMDLLRNFVRPSACGGTSRTCHFKFFLRPLAVHGSTRVEGVEFARTTLSGDPFAQVPQDTGEREFLRCGLLFRSVGYRGRPICDLPFEPAAGTIRNVAGRVTGANGESWPGLYAVGWIKRGATGIIGTNRADSIETVEALLADKPRLLAKQRPGAPALVAKIRAAGRREVTFDDWKRIDRVEVAAGRPRGKPREKMTTIDEMLAACT
jgi:ferredoxin--NADP+ reductase